MGILTERKMSDLTGDLSDGYFNSTLTLVTGVDTVVQIVIRDVPMNLVDQFNSVLTRHMFRPVYIGQLIRVGQTLAIVPASYIIKIYGFDVTPDQWQKIINVSFSM